MRNIIELPGNRLSDSLTRVTTKHLSMRAFYTSRRRLYAMESRDERNQPRERSLRATCKYDFLLHKSYENRCRFKCTDIVSPPFRQRWPCIQRRTDTKKAPSLSNVTNFVLKSTTSSLTYACPSMKFVTCKIAFAKKFVAIAGT